MTEEQKANFKNSYIQTMVNGIKLEYDVILNGVTTRTFSDPGDAKSFCIDNKLSRKIRL